MQPWRKFTSTLLADNTQQTKKECVEMQNVTKLERMNRWGGEERKQKCSQKDGVRKDGRGRRPVRAAARICIWKILFLLGQMWEWTVKHTSTMRTSSHSCCPGSVGACAASKVCRAVPLHPVPLSFSLHLWPLRVFSFVGTLLYYHLRLSYSFRKSESFMFLFFAMRCWKSSIKQYSSSGSCVLR